MKKIDLRETRLKSETVFKGELLHVIRDEVRLPDGRTSVREGIHHPGAVVILPFLNDTTLIMERQYRYMPDMIFYEVPAGKRDPGEDFLASAQRELEEETGYVAATWKFLTHLYPAIGFADEKMAVFAAYDLSLRETNRDHDEFLEIIEMPIPEALEMMKKGEISDGKSMVALFWAEKLMKGEW